MKNKSENSLDPKGLLWGFVSYAMWGFFPIYWKLLHHVINMEVLANRMLWSFVFYLSLVIWGGRKHLRTLFRQDRRTWILVIVASTILTFNWGIYIYAVNSGHIIEGSLAYFLNPILNVAVGVLFFKESFPLILKLSTALAALGVGTKLIFSPGYLWISIVLAISFCAYGVTKKMLTIPARTSSFLEGSVGLIPALAAMVFFSVQRVEPHTMYTWFLLVASGVVTGLPLFLFSFAAQRIPYSVMGMLQFIAPSFQFLVGLFIFDEPFSKADLFSFSLIWAGVALYLFQNLWRLKYAGKIESKI